MIAHKPKKILVVFGTRPEAIKMAPLVHSIRSNPDSFDLHVCVTAQHRQMLDQVLHTFEIIPEIDLDIMCAGQDLFDVTTKVLLDMKNVMNLLQPDIVLVHGDTTTALATSLSAFYTSIPVGHVEAGLRTYNIKAPFPEEFNRQIIGKIAQWHYAPTELARENLLGEGVSDNKIFVTGNTVVDALMFVHSRLNRDPNRSENMKKYLNTKLSFSVTDTKYLLITGHRRENFGSGFLQICEALKELAHKYKDIHFVYPVHLNPNVRNPVTSTLASLDNVHLIEPLDYEPFVMLLKYCYAVLTDSGGIQEEAPIFKKPVIVMREATERKEAVDAGFANLVGADKIKIIAGVSKLFDDKDYYAKIVSIPNSYGDGFACQRIVKSLLEL